MPSSDGQVDFLAAAVYFDYDAVLSTPTAMPDRQADKAALACIAKAREEADSLGGLHVPGSRCCFRR